MNYTYHKFCAVPYCDSNSRKTDTKLFVPLPRHPKLKKMWCEQAKRDWRRSTSAGLLFCEDHFDIKNDMVNYNEYLANGVVRKFKLRPGCVPTRFDCQPEKLRSRPGYLPHKPNDKGVSARQRRSVSAKQKRGKRKNTEDTEDTDEAEAVKELDTAKEKKKTWKKEDRQLIWFNMSSTLHKLCLNIYKYIHSSSTTFPYKSELNSITANIVNASARTVYNIVRDSEWTSKVPQTKGTRSRPKEPKLGSGEDKVLSHPEQLVLLNLYDYLMKNLPDKGALYKTAANLLEVPESVVLDVLRACGYIDMAETQITSNPDDAGIGDDDDDDYNMETDDIFKDPDPSNAPKEVTRLPEDLCDECEEDIVGFRYVCVQCVRAWLCGACAARGAHPAHYVLRAPGPATLEQIQAVLHAIRKRLDGNAYSSDEETISVRSDMIGDGDPLADISDFNEDLPRDKVLFGRSDQPNRLDTFQSKIDTPNTSQSFTTFTHRPRLETEEKNPMLTKIKQESNEIYDNPPIITPNVSMGIHQPQTRIVKPPTGIVKSQTGMVKSQTGIVKSQTGIIKSQTGMVKSQIGIVKSQTGIIKSQTGIVKSQAGILKSQTGIIKSQAGMVKSQTGILKSQTGMVKLQTGIIKKQTGIKPQTGKVISKIRKVKSQTSKIKSKVSINRPQIHTITSSQTDHQYTKPSEEIPQPSTSLAKLNKSTDYTTTNQDHEYHKSDTPLAYTSLATLLNKPSVTPTLPNIPKLQTKPITISKPQIIKVASTVGRFTPSVTNQNPQIITNLPKINSNMIVIDGRSMDISQSKSIKKVFIVKSNSEAAKSGIVKLIKDNNK